MYRDLPMAERLDRIGELLAKGVYLYLKNEESEKLKEKKILPTSKQVDRKNTLEDTKGHVKIHH